MLSGSRLFPERRNSEQVAAKITYTRRTPEGLLTTSNIAELFPDWKGADECWMFVSPHDDDVVIGAGLTFQVGLAEGARVHAVVVTDGRMGYCRFEQRRNITKIRRRKRKSRTRFSACRRTSYGSSSVPTAI